MSLVTEKPILVTGASGFIASHIIERLLLKGYKVRGTVRDVSDARHGYFKDFTNSSALELVNANLNTIDGWQDAVDGCEIVIHTASPFVLDVNDPQKDLVDPATNGVKFVFDACLKSGMVKKVVLTSSCAAIGDHFENDRIYDEKDWNDLSTLSYNPYYYSKTMAERAAYQFISEHNNPFKLAVINPFATVGPSYRKEVNQSVETFQRFLTGADPVIAPLGLGYVDVRDVADAHIAAAEKDVEGRFILHENSYTWPQLAEICRKFYPNHPIPPMSMPSTLVKLVVKTCYPKGQRDFVLGNLNSVPQLDNTRSKEILGIKYRNMEETIKDCCEDLIKHGFVPQTSRKRRFVFF